MDYDGGWAWYASGVSAGSACTPSGCCGAGIDAAFDFAGVPVVREQALSVLAPKGLLVLVD